MKIVVINGSRWLNKEKPQKVTSENSKWLSSKINPSFTASPEK